MNHGAIVGVQQPAMPDLGTRSRLLAVALEAFSSTGYDGVSVRDVERKAAVNRGLVAYHFGSKEGLWRETVNWLMARFHDEFVPYQDMFRDVSPEERERVLLIVFTRFCAKHPEHFRLQLIEGDLETERMQWFVDQHVRPSIKFFNRVVGRPEELTANDVVSHFAFTGFAATIFAMPALTRMLFGTTSTDPRFVDMFVHVAARVGQMLPQLVIEAVAAQQGPS